MTNIWSTVYLQSTFNSNMNQNKSMYTIPFQVFSEGYSNRMYHCHPENIPNGLVCRVFASDIAEAWSDVIDRNQEVRCMQVAHACGVSQPVRAVFRNGIIYGYAPGRTLKYEDMRKPAVIR